MRTRITGGWVVGFERGTHALWRDGVVVIEDDRVLHVGPPFDGRVDREIDARGKLVSPGFIDCHVHSGHRASHRLITDTGRPDYYGQPFLDISVPREGTRVGGDPRYLRPDAPDAEAGTRLHAEFTLAELLRATRKAAGELRVPITIHAAYSVIEFHDILHEHRMTPVELLGSVGLLGPDVTIGHGNMPAESYRFFAGGRDVELMGRRGVSISHCPVNIARRGRTLDSWQRYHDAGVNIALGSDTYPRDMIMQMRMASYFGKVTSGDLGAASAAEVFAAATLGGACALGRDDLGRLAPGAKADVVIVDVAGRDTLRWGPVRDPIKSLVECGIADDVETVLVDGIVRMENRSIPGVDLPGLRARAQADGEEVWSRLAEWDPLRRTAEQMSPWSFPMKGADETSH